jgi:4-hydroxy-4-methyl-2-oxoglutarate aldolase
MDYNVPVCCGGVMVSPGDVVFGDYDGIVVVPGSMLEQVVEIATDKMMRENHSRTELREGAYLRDVYAKYGVL